MKSFATQTLLLMLFLLMGASASATTTGLILENCDAFGCEGSSVSLTVEELDGGNFNVILSIDTTSYDGPEPGIVQAGFKAIEGADDVTLVSFDDGSWSDANTYFAGINSSGSCAGGPDPDFVCSSGYTNIDKNFQGDGIYTWTYYVEGGTLLDEFTIKFQYGHVLDPSNPKDKNSGHLISAPGNSVPVPEPSAALVFAGALLIVAPKLRRLR